MSLTLDLVEIELNALKEETRVLREEQQRMESELKDFTEWFRGNDFIQEMLKSLDR